MIHVIGNMQVYDTGCICTYNDLSLYLFSVGAEWRLPRQAEMLWINSRDFLFNESYWIMVDKPVGMSYVFNDGRFYPSVNKEFRVVLVKGTMID